jgi:N-acetylmuramoyl-L-alanine amidase
VHHRKWIVGLSVIFILMGWVSVWGISAAENSMKVFLEDYPLDSQVKALERNGIDYINLPLLSRYLNMVVAWDIEAHDLFLKFGKTNIKMFANRLDYYIDGKKQQFINAPFEKDQQFWLPVEFLARIGLKIKSRHQHQLRLVWTRNYLLGVENITYRKCPALLFIATQHLKVKGSIFKKTETLAFTLSGVTPHFALDQQIDLTGLSMIRDVRFDRNKPNTLTVLFDLSHAVGYQFVSLADHPNWLIMIFNYCVQEKLSTAQVIQEVKWSHASDRGFLRITSNGELSAEILRSKTTGKLSITLNNTQAAPGMAMPKIENPFVRELRFTVLNQAACKFEITLNRFIICRAAYSQNRRQLILCFHKSPLIGKTIVIDPGHGGIDYGAMGRQIWEKDVNFEIALRLKDWLEDGGARVILTRTSDLFLGLYERPHLANEILASLFISIHSNNQPDLHIHGVEVFHYPKHNLSRLLAQKVLPEITQQTELEGLGVKQEDFVVLRETLMPGILVEVGFLSNFREESIMKTSEFKEHTAIGIYQGVVDYFMEDK